MQILKAALLLPEAPPIYDAPNDNLSSIPYDHTHSPPHSILNIMILFL